MSSKRRSLKDLWRLMRQSNGFHKTVTFLTFVFIAALFWFILALNDNVQDSLAVKVNIENVPDSVTFINVPPADIHVMVRDKGTNLLRNGVFSHPSININFRDYSSNGIFRMSRSELNGMLKNTFGASATIISSSTDSLRLTYVTGPGKRIPIDVVSDIHPAAGRIISGVTIEPTSVIAYSDKEISDTLSKVYTEKISKRGLEESVRFPVTLKSTAGVRIIPETANVEINVEPLVRKESTVAVKVMNAPAGEDLILFPPRIGVEYYLPMSKYNSYDPEIGVWVDYNEIDPARNYLPVHIGNHPHNVVNLSLKDDRVEYVIAHE